MPSTPAVEPGTTKSSSVALSWTEVLCAEAYEVSYVKVAGDGQVMTKRTPDLSVPVDGLLANTAYRFVVRACVGSSWSAPSAGVSVQMASAPPDPALAFRGWADDPGGAFTIAVTWSVVPGAEMYAIDGSQELLANPARTGTTESSEDVACAKGDSEVEYVCENLAPDEAHPIAVAALNSNGDPSDPGTAVACLGPCELVVSEVTTSGLLLSWTGLERYRAPQQSVLLHEARVLLGENELAKKSGSHRAYKTLSISSRRVRPPTWLRYGSTAARAAGTQGGWRRRLQRRRRTRLRRYCCRSASRPTVRPV